MTPPQVFIFCADASHARRSAVDKFARGEEGWRRVLPSTGRKPGAGVTLVGDRRPVWIASTAEELDATMEPSPDERVRFRLYCRKCRRRPLPVRADRLWVALDSLVAAGGSEVEMSTLAAILGKQSEQSG